MVWAFLVISAPLEQWSGDGVKSLRRARPRLLCVRKEGAFWRANRDAVKRRWRRGVVVRNGGCEGEKDPVTPSTFDSRHRVYPVGRVKGVRGWAEEEVGRSLRHRGSLVLRITKTLFHPSNSARFIAARKIGPLREIRKLYSQRWRTRCATKGRLGTGMMRSCLGGSWTNLLRAECGCLCGKLAKGVIETSFCHRDKGTFS